MKKEDIIETINTKYKDYQGYVQFSHRPIDKKKDIFLNGNVKVENETGFIYEAHFYNGKDSITIKQVNDSCLVDVETDTSLENTQTYIGIDGLKVKMAQIWKETPDSLCEDMKVKKLKKVVFVGFEKGESK
jgi:CRISPR type III-associated protein (TIGR04423 family)